MTESVSITLENRKVLGKKVATLRRVGILPATVYGKNLGPFSVQLPLRDFQAVYRKIGRTKVVELVIPGQAAIAAFVHTLQRHPMTREIIHVDFHAVDLKQAMTLAVPVHLVGVSVLVSRGDAVLNQALNSIEVSALPMDLPSYIEVDVSDLDAFDKNIHVSDIVAPANTTIVTDGDELVVNLTPIRAAAEEETEEGESAEPELIREKRDDED